MLVVIGVFDLGCYFSCGQLGMIGYVKCGFRIFIVGVVLVFLLMVCECGDDSGSVVMVIVVVELVVFIVLVWVFDWFEEMYCVVDVFLFKYFEVWINL